MTDLNEQPVETAKQPAIADVLGITYDEPIRDDKACSITRIPARWKSRMLAVVR